MGDEFWQVLDRIATLGGAGWTLWTGSVVAAGAFGWLLNHLTNRPLKRRLDEIESVLGGETEEGPGTREQRFAALAPALREDLGRISGAQSSEKRVYWLFKLQKFEVFAPPVWQHRLWGMFAPAVLVSMEHGDLDAARRQSAAIYQKMMEDTLRENKETIQRAESG